MKGWKSTTGNEKYLATYRLKKDFDIREDGMIRKGTLIIPDKLNVLFLSTNGKPLIHSKLGFITWYSLDYFKPFSEWFEEIT
jgi:hypothetical protein